MHHLCSGLAALLAHHHVRVRQKEREGEKDGERGRERGIASDQYRRRGRTSQADSRWARSGLPEFHTPLCVCHPKRPEGGDHPRKRVETRNYANRSRNRGKTVCFIIISRGEFSIFSYVLSSFFLSLSLSHSLTLSLTRSFTLSFSFSLNKNPNESIALQHRWFVVWPENDRGIVDAACSLVNREIIPLSLTTSRVERSTGHPWCVIYLFIPDKVESGCSVFDFSIQSSSFFFFFFFFFFVYFFAAGKVTRRGRWRGWCEKTGRR